MKKLPLLFTQCVFWLAGCSSVDVLNATIPSDGYHVIRNVPYAAHDRGRLDIYVPDHPLPGHPAVVFYYGGSWKTGSKDNYLFAGQAFASQGIITIIPDYRLYPEIRFPDFMFDVAEAFAWTHHHITDYGGSAENLFVAGHSAGAYNAVMLATNPTYIHASGGSTRWMRGVIGLAGPYDFLPLTDKDLIDMFGGDRISTTQPIHYVTSGAPPMVLMAGDADDEVDPGNSTRMATALRGYDDQVETISYPGIGHIGIALSLADGFRNRAPVLQDSVSFIRAHTATSP